MKRTLRLNKTTRNNYVTYAVVILAFLVMQILSSTGGLSSTMEGMLVPICAYVVMAVSLNLTVGVLGELSLGHAGFMSVGAFTGVTAALAGAAGTLFAMNYTTIVANKFDFNTSILILVFVVLGGLGNMLGSIIAATALTILPEALREFSDYRMLVYAIVLILVMLATNNDTFKSFLRRLKPGQKKKKEVV